MSGLRKILQEGGDLLGGW